LSPEYAFARNIPTPKGQWTHLAVVWDAKALKGSVFLNGALEHEAEIIDPAWTPADQLFAVGGGKMTAIGFIGQLDDVRLYARPLSREEVRELAVR
jgi:hypothetical protein